MKKHPDLLDMPDAHSLHTGKSNTVFIARRLSATQEKRRRQVIQAARSLANEGGYEAVSIDAVCVRANVARGTVYSYFGSKDHLLGQVLVNWVDECSAELRRDPPAGASTLDRIVETFRRVLDGVLREQKLFRAIFQALSSTEPAVVQLQGRLALATAEYLQGVLVSHSEIDAEPLCMILGHVFASLLVGVTCGRVQPETVMNDLIVTVRVVLASPEISTPSAATTKRN